MPCHLSVCLGFIIAFNNAQSNHYGQIRPPDSSFEHPKHMFKHMDKKIITILPYFCISGPISHCPGWASLPYAYIPNFRPSACVFFFFCFF